MICVCGVILMMMMCKMLISRGACSFGDSVTFFLFRKLFWCFWLLLVLLLWMVCM